MENPKLSFEEFQPPPPDAVMLGEELRRLLATINDADTSIDSGGGFGQRDLWVWFQGNEYLITIKSL